MFVIPLRQGAANAHQRFAVQLGENLISFEIDFISYLDSPAWSMNLLRDDFQKIPGYLVKT